MADVRKALDLIQRSGVVNTKMTLDEIIKISIQLEGVDGDASAEWTFIGPNWVYKGSGLKALNEDLMR
ncbi:MAG: hypothetical protein EOP22_18905 [Hyphomicrobiales bacterium]|nr:MAG: hypothetical protein EOP22_18905 [Hyphomicrobiales bacterium]